MAQTGFTPILLYSTSTAAAVPAVGNLTNSTLGSELAINITDGKLFYKDNANAIQVIAWKVTPATAGGTGQTSYAVGDILYANTTTSLAKLADVATGNALISGGVGVAPSYGKIGLTTHVSGVLPVANGGTNASTASITSFNNITGYTASGATGTTSTNLVFSTSPTLITPTLGAALATSIKFGSGTVLSSYEQGSWTPEINTTVPPTTPFGQYNDGATYTKIGNVVYISGMFRTNGVTIAGASGNLYIGGLPFAPSSALVGGVTCVQTGSFATNAPRFGFPSTASRMILTYTPTATGNTGNCVETSLTTGAGLNNLIQIFGFYTV
jgi:hypothetical protein